MLISVLCIKRSLMQFSGVPLLLFPKHAIYTHFYSCHFICESSTFFVFILFQEVKKYLRECIQIFSYEPTCIQEGRLAAIARLDLVELETFVDSIDKSVAIDKGNK